MKLKSTKCAALAIVACLLLSGCGGSSGNASAAATPEPTPEVTATPAPTADPAQAAADKVGVSLGAYKALADAFAQVGVENISKMETTSEGFVKVPYESEDVYAFYDGETVQSVYVGDTDLFVDGVAVASVSDVVLSDSQKISLATWAQEDVESNLKAPKSAEFPWGITTGDYTFSRGEDGEYIIASYVDAENSFGAKLRSNFTVSYTWDGDNDNRPVLVGITIE